MNENTDDLREKTIRSISLFKGNLLNLRLDKVSLPSGDIAGREVVEHPGAAAIVPVFDEGDVLLVRQWRQPLQKVTLEIPAGTLDPHETPLECAERELGEETGYRAESIELLSCISLTPGYSDEIIHIFLATGLRSLPPDQWQPDDDENLHITTMPMDEVISACATGDLHDGKTVAAVLMACQKLHG